MSLNSPKSTFLETIFRPLESARLCWPSNFLQALEIDQGLLALNPKWDGVPKKFKGEDNFRL